MEELYIENLNEKLKELNDRIHKQNKQEDEKDCCNFIKSVDKKWYSTSCGIDVSIYLFHKTVKSNKCPCCGKTIYLWN